MASYVKGLLFQGGQILGLHFWGELDLLVPWGSLLGWKVLDEAGLESTRNLEVKPKSAQTPLEKALERRWDEWANKLPPRLAPSVVTLVGFIPILLSFLAAWYYCPDFATPPPRWLCFAMSLSLWIYQTFDALDVRQATRVEALTPLYQLFDQGESCLACLSHHSMAACILLPGPTTWNLVGLAALQTSYFVARWEENHTGILYTTWAGSSQRPKVGITESQWALMLLLAAGGILGPNVLKSLFSAKLIWGLTVSNLCITLWVLFNLCLIYSAARATFDHGKNGGAGRRKGLFQRWQPPSITGIKGRVDKKKACMELAPVVWLNIVLICGWHADVIALSPRALSLSFGFLMTYITSQMIVFSMAGTAFNPVQFMLIPFTLLAFASKMAWLPLEMFLVRMTLTVHAAVAFCLVLFWIITVMKEIKAHLHLNIFTLTPPQHEKDS